MKSSELIRILQDGIEKHGDKELHFHNSSDGESLDLVHVDYDWDNAEECFLQYNYSRAVIEDERVGIITYEEIEDAVEEAFKKF